MEIANDSTFSEDGQWTYVRGQLSIFQNCVIYGMLYFEQVEIAKDVSLNDGDKLYYTRWL